MLSANPFSPNGDGINDDVRISFDLFLVLDQVDTTLDIYDISGRHIRTIETIRSSAGNIALRWDGTDRNGRLVVLVSTCIISMLGMTVREMYWFRDRFISILIRRMMQGSFYRC